VFVHTLQCEAKFYMGFDFPREANFTPFFLLIGRNEVYNYILHGFSTSHAKQGPLHISVNDIL